MSTTGTLIGTNISPSKPLINRGLRAICVPYKDGTTTGTYEPDLTKNFLHGLILDDVDVAPTTREKIEVPLRALQGVTKRFVEGERTGGNITLNFSPDADEYIPHDIPEPLTTGGLVHEPHFVLWLGFLSASDPNQMIAYVESPVNIDSEGGLNFPKNGAATCALNFYISGDGLRIGKNRIGATLAYTEPT